MDVIQVHAKLVLVLAVDGWLTVTIVLVGNVTNDGHQETLLVFIKSAVMYDFGRWSCCLQHSMSLVSGGESINISVPELDQ